MNMEFAVENTEKAHKEVVSASAIQSSTSKWIWIIIVAFITIAVIVVGVFFIPGLIRFKI